MDTLYLDNNLRHTYFVFDYCKTDFYNMYAVIYKSAYTLGFVYFDDNVSFYRNNDKVFAYLLDNCINCDNVSFKLIDKFEERRLSYVQKENAKAY